MNMDFKRFFDTIKRGDLNEVINQVNTMGIDVKNLKNDAENFEQTPLFEACAVRDRASALNLVRYFLNAGVDPKQQDNLKQVSLFYAVREGHSEVIDLLIQYGADVNHTDTYGQTAIFYCIREGNIPTTQQLVSKGADYDVVDFNGETAIFYAIKYNKYEMCEYLVQRGANVRIENKKGKTASHFAKKHQKQQILELLIKHGAVNVNAPKKINRQPAQEVGSGKVRDNSAEQSQ